MSSSPSLKYFRFYFYSYILYLFDREIFRVLDLMKVDMINATILSLREVLCREGIEYERARFQRILDKTPSKYRLSQYIIPYGTKSALLNSDECYLTFLPLTSSGALRHTTSWLKSAMEKMMSATVGSQETGGQDKAGGNVPNPIPILNTAFLGIPTWDYEKKPLPEVCVAHSINCIICQQNSHFSFFFFFCCISDFDE